MTEKTLAGTRPVTGYLPYLALAVGIVGLSLSAMFVRWAGAPGPVSGFYRVSIAATALGLPIVARERRNTGRRPITRHYLLVAALAGLFFSGDLSTWNTSVMMTSAANATLLGNTAPVWVSLVALLVFKEKLGTPFWVGLGLALAGAAVILGSDSLNSVAHPTLGLGDVLALTAGVFYGLFLATTQRAREGLSSTLSWWVAACVSSAALLVISLALHEPITGYSAASYASLVAAALVSQVGGYLSINYALGYLPASVVSPTLLGQPVLTAVLAVPLLGESIGWTQAAGGALVLVGIWFVNRPRET